MLDDPTHPQLFLLFYIPIEKKMTTKRFLTHDYFILFTNGPGILISLWLNFGAAKIIYCENFIKQREIQKQFNSNNEDFVIADEPVFPTDDEVSNDDIETPVVLKEPGKKNGYMDVSNTLVPINSSFNSHEFKVLLIMALWICTFTFIKFANMSHRKQVEIVGIIVNVNLVVFFGAPLSTISKVLQTRSSASIHLGTMFLNILSTTFWTIYGIGLMSPYVIIPNGLGLILGIIQGLLCLLFPRKIEENNVEFTLNANDEEVLI